jgi:outer membrane lipoprotein SlyB
MEREARQKLDTWKKVVIFGGAALGGLAGWHFAGTHGSVIEIIIGVILGAAVAKWVWDFSNQESDGSDVRSR